MKITAILSLIFSFSMFANGQTNSPAPVESEKTVVAKNDSAERKAEVTEVKVDDPKTSPAGGFVAEKGKPFKVPKFSASPVIDGKLDDEVWTKAAKLEGFIQTQPGDGAEASKQTIAYLGYDESHFYIGIYAFDEPDKIRASVAQRDRVFSEDNVRLYLDTYDDQRRAYVIGFNPLGIQQDGILSEGVEGNNGGVDYNVDILMESKGTIVADGWIVEAKIPFKSLRYTAGKGKNWGIHVWRNIDRFNDEMDSWMPINRNRNSILAQAGKLTGLDEIKSERTLEIVPTLTFKQTGRRVSPEKFSNPAIEPDFGFTAKYSISSNITLDAAYNPDFADVEADAPVVEANQRFPIFFEEKRPFFLEGVEIFKTPIFAVNTRQIQNPDVAVKLTGKVGKNSFGIMAALDDPISGNPLEKKATIGVVRLKRDFGKESHFGFLGTTYNLAVKEIGPREFQQKRNHLGGFDVRWKISDTATFFAQALGTHSRNEFYNPLVDQNEYRTGNALIYNYEYNNHKKLGGWGFGGVGRTRDYRADVGFTRRTNTNEIYGYKSWSSDPKPKNFLIRRNINLNFGFNHDFQGRFQGINSNVNFNLSLRGNMFTGAGFYVGAEKLIEEEFGPKRGIRPDNGEFQAGAFSGDPDRLAKQYGGWSWVEKRFNKRVFLFVNFQWDMNAFDYDFGGGDKFPRVSPAYISDPATFQFDPGTGTQISLSTGANLKPTDSLDMSLSYNKSRLNRNDTGLPAFDANIFQLRSTYNFSRFVFLKARIDYNTINNRLFGQYTFGWTPSPGKAFYVGYNDRWSNNGYEFNPRLPGFNQLDRTFFIKFSYLFRKSF